MIIDRFVVGESSMEGILKGFVASVDITTKFLDEQTQVKLLHLANLQLKTPMATMAVYFSPNLVELVLSNMLLTEIPAWVLKLEKVERLYVKQHVR